MKMFSQVAAPALVAAVLLTTPALGRAEAATNNTPQPHFRGQAPGEAQKILRKLSGTVSAVDTNSLTLLLEPSGKPRKFQVTPRTKFTRNEHARAAFGELTVSNKVEVTFQTGSGRSNEAITVHIKPE